MVHADGQATQPLKQDTRRVMHQDAPAPVYGGWKDFYDEDSPTLTLEETIARVIPTPQLVSYQQLLEERARGSGAQGHPQTRLPGRRGRDCSGRLHPFGRPPACRG